MTNEPIKTPEGKDLVLIEKMTAGKRNQLRSVMLKGVNMSAKLDHKVDARPGDNPSVTPHLESFNLDVLTEEKEHAQIKVAVTSYDGKTNADEILAALLDASPEEYDFVVGETDKVLSKVNFS